MQFKTILNSRLTAVVAGGAVITVLGATAGFAAASITSADIADETIRSKDVMNGSLKLADFGNSAEKSLQGERGAQGPAGADGAPGQQGPRGASGAGAAYAGPEWSLVDRNSIGSFAAGLRAGPSSEAFGASVKPPLGVGSLGLQTGSPSDKVAFGNQEDFAGDTLASINTVKYSVYTTGENIAKAPGAVNLPGVSFEIDPTGPSTGTGGNYSSLVYVPVTAASGWSEQDASTADQWFLTGAAATGTCNQGPEGYCTLAEVKAFYPEATLHTAAVTKGRDYAFSGAVDAFQINDTVYDFEPFGVTGTPAP